MRRILLLLIVALLISVSEAVKKLDNPESLNYGVNPRTTTVFLRTSQSGENLLITHSPYYEHICIFEWDNTFDLKTPMFCIWTGNTSLCNPNAPCLITFRHGTIVSKPDSGILFLIGKEDAQVGNAIKIVAWELRTSDPSTWVFRGSVVYPKDDAPLGLRGIQVDIDRYGNLFISTEGDGKFYFLKLENRYNYLNIFEGTSLQRVVVRPFPCVIESCYYSLCTCRGANLGLVGVLDNLTAVAVYNSTPYSFLLFNRVGDNYVFSKEVSFGQFIGYDGLYFNERCNGISTIDGFLDSVLVTCKEGFTRGIYIFNLTNMSISKIREERCPERARLLPDGFVYYTGWNPSNCNTAIDSDVFKTDQRVIFIPAESGGIGGGGGSEISYETRFGQQVFTAGVVCGARTNNPGILLACGISNWTLENIPGLIMLAVAAFIIYFIYSILKI